MNTGLNQEEAVLNAEGIATSTEKNEAILSAPDLFQGFVRFSLPEFFGKTNGKPFGIIQALEWTRQDGSPDLTFNLGADPLDIGIVHEGVLSPVKEDELYIETSVRNIQESPIYAAHHTLFLDTSDAAGFNDPGGKRTFVFTNTGWYPIADLINPQAPGGFTLRIGAAYRGNRTVIWKLIACVDEANESVLAMAIDRGYAFSSQHPEWPKGLLGGCRWGTLASNERKTMRGRIYMIHGTLNDLRLRYTKDFK